MEDDAAGMSMRDLEEYFFHMHADKPRNPSDRNRFCTGVKLAALSAGRRLDVHSVKDKKVIECSLDASRIANNDPSVSVLESSSREPDGTHLCLSGIRQRFSVQEVRQHLASRFRAKCRHRIFVNGSKIAFEPPRLSIHAKPSTPDSIRIAFGKCSLVMGYSESDLPKPYRGVAFVVGEHVHELSFLGAERNRTIAPRLFGEFHCERLPGPDRAGRTAITRERNGLNDEHEQVKELKQWVSASLTKLADEARKSNLHESVDPELEKHCKTLSKNMNKAMSALLREMDLSNVGHGKSPVDKKGRKAKHKRRNERKHEPEGKKRKRLGGLLILPRHMGSGSDRAFLDSRDNHKTVLWINADDHCLSGLRKGSLGYIRTFDEIAVSEMALTLAERSLELGSNLSAADPNATMAEACPDFAATVRNYERELAKSCSI